jgi:hypothetical protein
MALSHGTYINFGDATEQNALQPGIVSKLAERTGVPDLRALLVSPKKLEGRGVASAKLPIVLRDFVWWDGNIPAFPASAFEEAYLPDCAIVKFSGQLPGGQRVLCVAKAGHNDGHHSHTDIGHFIINVAGESLLCDPGRGLYSGPYFRHQRYENFFANSLSHSVPRIDGRLQVPGPEFGGSQQYHGKIQEHGEKDGCKYAIIDIQAAYDIPALELACRSLSFNPTTGETTLVDDFAFSGAPLPIEEALLTWAAVKTSGHEAEISGTQASLKLEIVEPAGAAFVAEDKSDECRINERAGTLTRLAIQLPVGATRFVLKIVPSAKD